MYQSAYLIGSLIFGLLWLFLFLLRPDLKREMLTLSFLAGLLGPISEHFYTADYWHPQYFFSQNFGIEDFLAGFFLGGIGAVGYEVFWHKYHKYASSLKITWVLPLIALLGLVLMIFFFHVLQWNSIYSSITSFIIVAAILLIIRPELIPAALGSGLILAVVMFIFYLIYQQIYPGIITKWWELENISGILLLGVPIEELLWGFSWGMIAGPLYEFAARLKLK